MTQSTKFEIGKDYYPKHTEGLHYSYVPVARNDKKVTFLEVTNSGGFHFTIEREILNDNNGEYVLIDEYNGYIYAATDKQTPFMSHLRPERADQLQYVIDEESKKYEREITNDERTNIQKAVEVYNQAHNLTKLAHEVACKISVIRGTDQTPADGAKLILDCQYRLKVTRREIRNFNSSDKTRDLLSIAEDVCNSAERSLIWACQLFLEFFAGKSRSFEYWEEIGLDDLIADYVRICAQI